MLPSVIASSPPSIFYFTLCPLPYALCPSPYALFARNLQPATRNPQPVTRNPQPVTRNPQPATRNPNTETLTVMILQRLYQGRQCKIHRCFQTEPFGLAHDKPVDGSNFCLSPVIHILSHG